MITYENRMARLKKNGANCYQAFPRHVQTLSRSDFAEEMAQSTGFSPEVAELFLATFVRLLEKHYNEGTFVNLGELRAGVSIHGSVSDPLLPWDRSGLELKPYIMLAGRLRKCLNGERAVNVTEGPSATIEGLLDTVHAVNWSIIGMANVVVNLIGTGLDVEASEPDEGAWLEDEKGNVVARAVVTKASITMLDCTFAELPPSGRYRFVVATRAGLGIAFPVRRTKRWVTVERR